MKSKTTRKVNVNETKTSSKRVILLLVLLSTQFWAAGCEDYHSSSQGYYGSAYYAGGSAVVAERDRRYYRGPGYWYGRVYYVWEPGHWAWRTGIVPPGMLGNNLPNNGHLLWVHGHYIAQGQ